MVYILLCFPLLRFVASLLLTKAPLPATKFKNFYSSVKEFPQQVPGDAMTVSDKTRARLSIQHEADLCDDPQLFDVFLWLSFILL